MKPAPFAYRRPGSLDRRGPRPGRHAGREGAGRRAVAGAPAVDAARGAADARRHQRRAGPRLRPLRRERGPDRCAGPARRRARRPRRAPGAAAGRRSPSSTSRTRPSATGAPPSGRSCTRTRRPRCRWCSRLLGGSVDVVGPGGRRTIAADDLYVGPLESSVRPDEIAVEAFFPALADGAGVAFEEIARRHGDYAMCGVAALVTARRGGDRGEAGLPLGQRRADGRGPDRRARRGGWATPRWRTSTRPTTSTPRRTTGRSWCGCSPTRVVRRPRERRRRA